MAKKFRKHNSPAFYHGEVWTACDGSGIKAIIESVEKYGPDTFDFTVTYKYSDGTIRLERNGWAFQVRYYHTSD